MRGGGCDAFRIHFQAPADAHLSAPGQGVNR
jgi:hypothetical protein